MNEKTEGLIGTLNDTCFVEAGDCLTTLCQMIEEESGVKPSLHDLCELLAVSLRGCSHDLLSDVDVMAIERLTPKVARHKRIRLKPGDILAVPRERGGYYLIIFITTNRFSDAFGIFQGHRQVPYVPPKWDPVPLKYPVYTGTAEIVTGRWRRIDRREDLLELFPKSPEIYHRSSAEPTNNRIGPHGSAESPSGYLRHVTEAEANEIGLIQGTYIQVMHEKQFEWHLQKTLS